MLPPLCLEEEGRPWSLPLYPKLGHLPWDDQDIDQPGTIFWSLQVSAGALPATVTQGTEHLQANRRAARSRGTAETEEPQTPPGVEAAARRLSSPIIWQLGQTTATRLLWNQPCHLTSWSCWLRTCPSWPQRLWAAPHCLWSSQVLRLPLRPPLPRTIPCDRCSSNNTSQHFSHRVPSSYSFS